MDGIVVEEVSGGVERSKIYSMTNDKLIELSFNRIIKTGLIEFRIATISPIDENEFSIIAPAVGLLGFYADYAKDSKMAVLVPSTELKSIRSVDDLRILLNALSELIEEMAHMYNEPVSNIEVASMLNGKGWLVSMDLSEAYKVIRVKDYAVTINIRLRYPDPSSATISVGVLGKIINHDCVVRGFREAGLDDVEVYEYAVLAKGTIRTLGLLTVLAERFEGMSMRVVERCSSL